MPNRIPEGGSRRGASPTKQAATVMGICVGMVLIEVSLVALVTGHAPNRVTSTLFANIEFFATFLLEAPGATLRLLLIDKPLFEVAAVQAHGGLDVWRLHYFNYATVVHVGLAVWLVRRWPQVRASGTRGVRRLGTGMLLLLVSSLYLFHISCCTGGPLWIVHTGLIAHLFNPVTGSSAMLDAYTAIQPWLGAVQAGFALAGAWLVSTPARGATAARGA